MLHQIVEPPLQPSDVHNPPLPQLLAFSIQRDMPPLQPLSTCAYPPLLSVLPQGIGEPPLLPSDVCAYVPLLYALHIFQGVPLRQPLADTVFLPQLSALPLQ